MTQPRGIRKLRVSFDPCGGCPTNQSCVIHLPPRRRQGGDLRAALRLREQRLRRRRRRHLRAARVRAQEAHGVRRGLHAGIPREPRFRVRRFPSCRRNYHVEKLATSKCLMLWKRCSRLVRRGKRREWRQPRLWVRAFGRLKCSCSCWRGFGVKRIGKIVSLLWLLPSRRQARHGASPGCMSFHLWRTARQCRLATHKVSRSRVASQSLTEGSFGRHESGDFGCRSRRLYCGSHLKTLLLV